MLEYQNIKILLQKVTMLLMILMEKKWLERLTKTNCKMQIKTNLELKKVMKRKGDKLC